MWKSLLGKQKRLSEIASCQANLTGGLPVQVKDQSVSARGRSLATCIITQQTQDLNNATRLMCANNKLTF